MNTKKRWQCLECQVYAKNKECDHADALVKEGPTTVLTSNVDRFATPEIEKSFYAKELSFRTKLKEYGLEQIRIEVLVLRFVYDLTLAEIAEELRIPNRQTAYYIIKRSQDLLKERKFKL